MLNVPSWELLPFPRADRHGGLHPRGLLRLPRALRCGRVLRRGLLLHSFVGDLFTVRRGDLQRRSRGRGLYLMLGSKHLPFDGAHRSIRLPAGLLLPYDRSFRWHRLPCRQFLRRRLVVGSHGDVRCRHVFLLLGLVLFELPVGPIPGKQRTEQLRSMPCWKCLSEHWARIFRAVPFWHILLNEWSVSHNRPVRIRHILCLWGDSLFELCSWPLSGVDWIFELPKLCSRFLPRGFGCDQLFSVPRWLILIIDRIHLLFTVSGRPILSIERN